VTSIAVYFSKICIITRKANVSKENEIAGNKSFSSGTLVRPTVAACAVDAAAPVLKEIVYRGARVVRRHRKTTYYRLFNC
jgi:hypothetical protein